MKKNVESILIIGLGMIGASLALASKSKGIKVFGYDSNDLALESANKENYIDDSFKSLEEINNKNLSDKIDLVIVCVPPRQTQEVLNNIHELWNTSMTITDTSSVKNHLKVKDVDNIILSHPIAGSDRSGLLAADSELYIDKKNVICDPFKANGEHLKRLIDFWESAMQMRTSVMTVNDHDLIFAITSHLPHLVSYALIDSIRLSSSNVEDNAGGGLKEFLRLSGSNSEMWSEIFTLNRVDLIKALAGLQISINNLLELITETKEIPDVFNHLEILRDELNEIKSFKEENF
ncbi:MAG: prephenate dehydrogenase [Gammaproteobacteria bacterium]